MHATLGVGLEMEPKPPFTFTGCLRNSLIMTPKRNFRFIEKEPAGRRSEQHRLSAELGTGLEVRRGPCDKESECRFKPETISQLAMCT